MKKVAFFELDNTLNTYTIPILKIVSCTAIIILLFFRNHFIHIEQLTWTIIMTGGSLIVGFACIFCIAISLAEILVVYEKQAENQKLKNEHNKECKWISAEKVVSLIGQNDIIEIQLVSDGSGIKVGASADIRPGDSVFFDKLYYIGNREFENLDNFHEELLKYSADGEIPIIAIDGVSPECYL